MTALETIKAVKEDIDKIARDIPMWHIVRGVQILDKGIYTRYFRGQRIEVKGRSRIKEMIDNEIFKKDSEPIAQLVMTLWTRSNGQLYHGMYDLVSSVNEKVDEIELIDDTVASEFCDRLLEYFDKDRIYWCILFNEVKFSKAVIEAKLGRTVPFEVWPPPCVVIDESDPEKAAAVRAAEEAMKTEKSSLFNAKMR